MAVVAAISLISIPGNKKAFPGLKDEADRKDVIA